MTNFENTNDTKKIKLQSLNTSLFGVSRNAAQNAVSQISNILNE